MITGPVCRTTGHRGGHVVHDGPARADSGGGSGELRPVSSVERHHRIEGVPAAFGVPAPREGLLAPGFTGMDGALSIVWNQRRCPGVSGTTSRSAGQNPSHPSPGGEKRGAHSGGKRRACGRVANGRAARDPFGQRDRHLRRSAPANNLHRSARFVPASSECRHGQRPSLGYGRSTSDRSRTEGRCCAARGQVDLDRRSAMIGVANGFARTRIGCGSSGTCGRLADLRPYGRHPARRIMHRPAFRANSRATTGS